MKLLNTNTKLEKGDDWLVAGLTFAPSDYSGRNVCKHAGFCKEVCVLWWRGRTVQKRVRSAAERRTNLFFEHKKVFEDNLRSDLDFLLRKSERDALWPACRLNAGSDIPWESVMPSIFTDYPDITFYDYTKYPSRAMDYALGKLPDNYHLTYSFNEQTKEIFPDWEDLLWYGANVSVVFDIDYLPRYNKVGNLPKKWRGYKVINGDLQDVRTPYTDGQGVIVGLAFKGSKISRNKSRVAGFIQ